MEPWSNFDGGNKDSKKGKKELLKIIKNVFGKHDYIDNIDKFYTFKAPKFKGMVYPNKKDVPYEDLSNKELSLLIDSLSYCGDPLYN